MAYGLCGDKIGLPSFKNASSHILSTTVMHPWSCTPVKTVGLFYKTSTVFDNKCSTITPCFEQFLRSPYCPFFCSNYANTRISIINTTLCDSTSGIQYNGLDGSLTCGEIADNLLTNLPPGWDIMYQLSSYECMESV